MSPSTNRSKNDNNELPTITLTDEEGATLACYIEQSLEYNDLEYLLLSPVDAPIVILAWDEDEDEDSDEDSEVTMVDEPQEINEIFDDAKAVLAELNLSLKKTAYTLTASGEIPPLEDEDDILTLDIEDEDDGGELESEELQFLASFYHFEQSYSIYTPVAPMLFFGRVLGKDKVELVSSEEQELKQVLEELLFNEEE